MKKTVFLIVFLLLAWTVFGQDFTFQGLPWGASKEQVIKKLGEPNSRSKSDTVFYYFVSLNGYKTMLNVSFWGDNGLFYANYNVNGYLTSNGNRELNEEQVNLAFLVLFTQLVEKYGAYTEQIFNNDDEGVHGRPRYWAWHFDNFHVSISSISLNCFSIMYYSTAAWKKNMEELSNWLRVPNNGL